MDLIPPAYRFDQISIDDSIHFQTAIRNRKKEIQQENKDDKQTLARLEELELLNLAIDRHISNCVRISPNKDLCK